MKTSVGMDKAKVWISENLGAKMATKLFRGVALGALLVAATGIYFSINQGAAGSPLASEQGACYPLYPELGPCPSDFVTVAPTTVDRYDRGLFDEVLPEDLKQGTVVSPLTIEQFEDWPEVGFDSRTYHRFISEQGKVGSHLSREQASTVIDRYDRGLFDEIPAAAVEYWPEVGLDSNTYHLLTQGKAVNPFSTMETGCYPEIQPC
jgi:hypothetical protein